MGAGDEHNDLDDSSGARHIRFPLALSTKKEVDQNLVHFWVPFPRAARGNLIHANCVNQVPLPSFPRAARGNSEVSWMGLPFPMSWMGLRWLPSSIFEVLNPCPKGLQIIV